MTATTSTARKVYQRSHSSLPYAPLTGRGLVDALNEAHAEWGSLSKLYPFECFPLDTMSERLRAHNEAHPDLWAASVRCFRIGDAIETRIDA